MPTQLDIEQLAQAERIKQSLIRFAQDSRKFASATNMSYDYSGKAKVLAGAAQEYINRVGYTATPEVLMLSQERNGILAQRIKEGLPEEAIRGALELKMANLSGYGSPEPLREEYEKRVELWRNNFLFVALAAKYGLIVPDDIKVKAVASSTVDIVTPKWKTSETVNAAIEHAINNPGLDTKSPLGIIDDAPTFEYDQSGYGTEKLRYNKDIAVRLINSTTPSHFSKLGSCMQKIHESNSADEIYAALEKKILAVENPMDLSVVAGVVSNYVAPHKPLDQKNADKIALAIMSHNRMFKPGQMHIEGLGEILPAVSDSVFNEAVKTCHTSTLGKYDNLVRDRDGILRKLLAEEGHTRGDIKRYVDRLPLPEEGKPATPLPDDIIDGIAKAGALSALIGNGHPVPTEKVHAAIDSILNERDPSGNSKLELQELLSTKQGLPKLSGVLLRGRELGAKDGGWLTQAATRALSNDRFQSNPELEPAVQTALSCVDASKSGTSLYDAVSWYQRPDGTFPAFDANTIERLRPLQGGYIVEKLKDLGYSHRFSRMTPTGKQQIVEAAVHTGLNWFDDADIGVGAKRLVHSLFAYFPEKFDLTPEYMEQLKKQFLDKHGVRVENEVGTLPTEYVDKIAASGDYERLKKLGNRVLNLSPQYMDQYIRQYPESPPSYWERLPSQYVRKMYKELDANPDAFGPIGKDIDFRLNLYSHANLDDHELEALSESTKKWTGLPPWMATKVQGFVDQELEERDLDALAQSGDPYLDDLDEYDDYDDDENEAPSDGHTKISDEEFKQKMKEWNLNPEAAKVGARFDTTKWRKLRDMIAAASPKRMLHEKEVQKILPGDWKRFKDGKGMISADTIQAHIDATPVRTYNVNHRYWMGEGYDTPARRTEDGDYDWDSYLSLQRHNDERQRVTRICASNEMVKEMRDQGVWESYKKLSSDLPTSLHPNTPGLTLGWVRWTGHPKEGIFMDEIQCDLHDNLNDAENYGVPKEHAKKLRKILYANKDPTAATGEVFFQWLRDQGHVGCKVAMHGLDSKAKISLGDYPKKPPPVHHRETYEVAPKKTWGMESTMYNEKNMPTQSNPHFQDKRQIWQDTLKTSEKQLALATLKKYEQGLELTEEEMDIVKAILGL